MKSVKFWYAVLAGVLLIGIIGTVFVFQDSNKTVVIIEQDGNVIERINLSEFTGAKEINISCAEGQNTVLIENGQIRMKNADCADQTCVKMGTLRSASLPVVCLPHRLVIRFDDSGSDIQLDGEVY